MGRAFRQDLPAALQWESTSLWGTKPLWGCYVSVQSGKASHLRTLLIPQILLAALAGMGSLLAGAAKPASFRL